MPRFEVAIGELTTPQTGSLYQQLHGYPVGASGKELAAAAHGSKYWIVPVRREILIDLDLMIGIRSADPVVVDQLKSGLRGDGARYGLPFLGDNNFLIDRLELLDAPGPVTWYSRFGDVESKPGRHTCRLTVDIDRSDSAKTLTCLYARGGQPCEEPPESAWTWVPKMAD